MSFSPAITSTTASALRIPLLWRCRFPISEPIKPPIPAASAYTGRASGRKRMLAKLPARMHQTVFEVIILVATRAIDEEAQ